MKTVALFFIFVGLIFDFISMNGFANTGNLYFFVPIFLNTLSVIIWTKTLIKKLFEL